MKIKDYALCKEIVIGRPKTIKDLNIIPVLDITLSGYNKFGYVFSASISAKSIIIINNNTGELSIYNFTTDLNKSDLTEYY